MYKIWITSHKLYRGRRRLAHGIELIYQIVCSNSISGKADIGFNTVFFHHGLGCVVHDDAVIGDNCKIFANVTIGNKWSDGKNTSGPPKIGNNVVIGAGSVIIGDITIGDNCVIGANSVVLKDVPPDSVIAGVPAKVIKRKNDR